MKLDRLMPSFLLEITDSTDLMYLTPTIYITHLNCKIFRQNYLLFPNCLNTKID